MNLVLLSGGSGKRLWPLSNEIRSKQFLKLLKDDENIPESMVQRVFRQIQATGMEVNITIATGAAQVESIKSQLGNRVDILQEPERRDTYPAIALSALYLRYVKNIDENEPIIVLPVDLYAGLEYFFTLKEVENAVRDNRANIVLMGINPTYPSAKYGYILPKSQSSLMEVKQFIEKPAERKAAELIEQGALWNAGVFGFKLGYLLDIIKKDNGITAFEDAITDYKRFEKISFDYKVVEQADSVAVVPFAGQWKDLGTWNTITEQMNGNVMGRATIAGCCDNTNVINELNIPVVAMGIQNAVIAVSPDGILVSDKHESSYIKPIVDKLIGRPMYEERHWGEYKVIDYVTYSDSMHSITKHVLMKAGEHNSYQSHKLRDEIWTIVDGTGEIFIDGHVRTIKRGDVAYIVKGQKHAIGAITDLHFMEVQIGEELTEEDIVRYEWLW